MSAISVRLAEESCLVREAGEAEHHGEMSIGSDAAETHTNLPIKA